jgi:uncharacterized protein (DUF4415 family)
MSIIMTEWDERKQLRTLIDRGLDFIDTVLRSMDDQRCNTGDPAGEGALSDCRDQGLLHRRMAGAARRDGSFPSGEPGMTKKEHIVRHTAEELAALRARGASRSNWTKSATMTKKQIEKSVADDPDESEMTVDWDNATVELPAPKAVLNMRIDRDVLNYFRKTGRGYQTRINAVLRAFVDRQQHRSR